MIYTSYFGMLRHIPDDAFPVSIALITPNWYQGACYKRLAPSLDILMEYKRTRDQERYKERYEREILSKLDAEKVRAELHRLDPLRCDIFLLCYERPERFCHRHLVADWFAQNGMPVTEASF